MTATQERTNKPGSLKRNFGGIVTEKIRNHQALDKLREEFERTRSGK